MWTLFVLVCLPPPPPSRLYPLYTTRDLGQGGWYVQVLVAVCMLSAISTLSLSAQPRTLPGLSRHTCKLYRNHHRSTVYPTLLSLSNNPRTLTRTLSHAYTQAIITSSQNGFYFRDMMTQQTSIRAYADAEHVTKFRIFPRVGTRGDVTYTFRHVLLAHKSMSIIASTSVTCRLRPTTQVTASPP